MKRIAVLYVIVTSLTLTLAIKLTGNVKANYAYICESKTAYAYHQIKDCSGLNRCTHRIVKVRKNDAIDTYGRRPCKVCY